MSNNTPTPPESCFTCPSMLMPDESARFFRKSIGAPVCARFGTPIGRMTSSVEEQHATAQAMASKCSEHGHLRPAAANYDKAQFRVTLPDPVLYQEMISETPEHPELVNTCVACKFFVREDIVVRDLGWSSGACAVKGKLLLANRFSIEARGCEMRSIKRNPIQSASGMTFLPEYEANFGTTDPVRAARQAAAAFVDPAEYETDKPVSEEEVESGIRAWRKVTDPATDNFVYLPIFRRDFFKPEEQELVPTTGDDEHPEDYVDHNFYVYKVAVLWMELDETPAFWGRAGTGKTEFFRHMAYLMQVPFYRFSITGSTELDDLAGKMHYTEGVGTHFEKGRLVRAWESVGVMVIDEPNAGPPDVWQFLRPMTDTSKQLVLDTSDGERSDRNDSCFLGMAMNPAWDILNVGTQPIGDADANRLMHLFIELPPEPLERDIIKTRCQHDGWEIPNEVLDMVMKIAKDIRALTDNGTLPVTWAIRPQLKVARALRWFDVITAYKMASADYLEPQQQQMLLDVVNGHIAGPAPQQSRATRPGTTASGQWLA